MYRPVAHGVVLRQLSLEQLTDRVHFFRLFKRVGLSLESFQLGSGHLANRLVLYDHLNQLFLADDLCVGCVASAACASCLVQ